MLTCAGGATAKHAPEFLNALFATDFLNLGARAVADDFLGHNEVTARQ